MKSKEQLLNEIGFNIQHTHYRRLIEVMEEYAQQFATPEQPNEVSRLIDYYEDLMVNYKSSQDIEVFTKDWLSRNSTPVLHPTHTEAWQILKTLVELKVTKDELDAVEPKDQDQPFVLRYGEYVVKKKLAWKAAKELLERPVAALPDAVGLNKE